MAENVQTPQTPPPAPEKKPGFWKRTGDWLYKNLIDGGPATISVVERIDAPMTVWESIKHTAISTLKGMAIGGLVSTLAGAVLGAFEGMGNLKFLERLQTGGNVKLGGSSVFGLGNGPAVTISNTSETIQSFAASSPTTTNMVLSAIDQGLNLGAKAAVVGAVGGAIKGGWVDRITKEREIVAARPLEPGKC